MRREQAFELVRQANPMPVGTTGPSAFLSRTALLELIDERSGDMQTHDKPNTEDRTMQRIEQKTERRTPSRGPSRRRGLLVAAAALVVAIIAAGVVIGLVGGSSDEPDVGSLQPGPMSSLEDIAGTYQRQGPGGLIWFQFFEDGTTFHSSQNRDLVEDRPQVVWQTRFEGTEILITTTSSVCPQPDQGGTYQIHLLENGNLEFVGVGEDGCGSRSGGFPGEWAPVP